MGKHVLALVYPTFSATVAYDWCWFMTFFHLGVSVAFFFLPCDFRHVRAVDALLFHLLHQLIQSLCDVGKEFISATEALRGHCAT